MKRLVLAVAVLTAAAAGQGFDPPLKKQVVWRFIDSYSLPP